MLGLIRKGWLAGAALFVLPSCVDSPAPGPAGGPPAPAAFERQLPRVAALIHGGILASALSAGDPLSRMEQSDAQALYEPRGHAPLWIDPTGRLRSSAREALAILGDAAADGLDSSDYDVVRLERLTARIDRATLPRAEDVAACDLELSAAMLRYVRHLRSGRVDPRTIGFTSHALTRGDDFPVKLRAALADNRLADAVEALAPPFVQYRALRAMLARYRRLAADPSLELRPAISGTLHPGESDAGLPSLGRRLEALGDLRSDAVSPGTHIYEGALVEAVKRFQIRHGLEPDGVLGRMTLAALHIPLARRVRQIELALERLRWLPDLGDRRFLALNIPMFHIWVWDSIPPTGEPAFGMRAIVGRALSTETPVFIQEMRSVIFRPYWNVPRSILLDEILPLVGRDPEYLNRQDMEIVRGPGDEAQPVAADAATLGLLKQGALRLRQRPGPQNALGLVKFVFDNEENVYLHGSPAQELFSRARRDFSHGCVRVEDPVALAQWVLKERPEWTRDAILAAMAADGSQSVSLPRPILVILFYTTAAVMPEDGAVRFADDIYGHDARLDRALARERRQPER
jgi:murein L,D-transpeptidase YcbB/YkuD